MSSATSTRFLRRFINISTHELRSCQPHRQFLYSRHLHRVARLSQSPLRRTFTSSHVLKAALASHPPGQPTELVSYPSEPSIEQAEDPDEPEMEPIPLEEAKIEMTERAAEQLQRISQRQNNSDAGLRIAVESGGCHGYQYKMDLATSGNLDDYHFSHPSVKPSNIYVDVVSMSLLKGSVIDFATELIGSSFRIAENPQAKGSGCGCGVSWELKI